jgi:hypothetical protein
MNDQDLVPERLGEYRLLDRIGEGGMGVVFLARDRRHRTVALKVLRSSVAGDPTARRRLAREVETMQRVRSPNVAEVIDADLDGGMPYIVTRFVPGRTLDDVVTQDGPLRGPALSRLASGLADALVAVHAAGVVHRDVKPGNVMLFQDTPVVIDFGIAQGPDATRLTMTGMFMGTPGYLAPEVIEGRPSSEASDVHAWGATVAFAAIGRPPYGTGPYEGIFYRIVNGQADLNEVPAPLVPLLAATLARDPAHRPSAVQLRAQAAVLDPATLVMNHGQGGQAAPGDAAARPATRSDAAAGAAPTAAPGGPAAYVPPAPVASGPAGYVPPTVVAPGAGGPTVLPTPGSPQAPGWPGMVAGNGAGPATSGPSTRPIAEGRPLPDDLADVLTPVSYARRDVAPRAAGAPAAPAPAPAARPATAPEPAKRVRGQALMVVAAVVLVASICVVLPVAGTAAALLLIAALRTAGLVQRRTAARRVARGARTMDPVVTVVTLPWLVLRALFAMLILAPFALAAAAVAAGIAVAVSPGAWPYHALAYAAGTLVLFYGLGPGSGMPRAQLRRFFGTFTKSPATRIVVVLGLAALALGALSAAVSSPSVYWPAVVPANFIHFGVTHLGPIRRLGYLPHLSVPHQFHLLHGRFLPGRFLSHLK